MDKPTNLIEFETMLLGRHLSAQTARPRRAVGRLDRSAYTLLGRIEMQGPMSIGELSDAFGLDASTLNRQTGAMLRDGLVERIPDPDGGMARKFRITGDGSNRLAEERAHSIRVLDEILNEWSPEDVATFAGWLERFNTDVERYVGRPWPRP
ncbi:MarR family winged helix-turn-helix transcriptional regulator [Rhodococcus phenolicus]|uniref:MarR family winged helix-turn-helix transcriptional regulator n=1 Tax=Rhodococcus phenolicus TaxID=263849 RepID=UPI0008363944|nr:MarR family transcriptional regulator [Rhodococcus phenolicus]